MGIEQLRATAFCQRGLFSWRQARECGFSGDRIRRRLASGAWRRVHGPVLAEAGLRLTPALRDRAVLLTIGTGVLAGPSAARVCGLPIPATVVETFVAVPRRRRALVGVRLVVREVPLRDRA